MHRGPGGRGPEGLHPEVSDQGPGAEAQGQRPPLPPGQVFHNLQ